MRVAWDTILIESAEDTVMMLRVLVEHFVMGEVVYDLPVNTPLLEQIGIYPAICVGFRLFKGLRRRCECFAVPDNSGIRAEQETDGFGVGAIRKAACKVNCIAAFTVVLIVPRTSADCYFFTPVPPFVLAAGAFELLSVTSQEICEVGLPRLFAPGGVK